MKQILEAKGLPGATVVPPVPQVSASGVELKKSAKEGAYTTEIDINDAKNRYNLTRGETQRSLHDETGAEWVSGGQ